jgi:hypothetical protein
MSPPSPRKLPLAAPFGCRKGCDGVELAPSIIPPISDAVRSAASFIGLAARCAYRCVVDACRCPNSPPMIGSDSPPLAATDAKAWRRSWTRRSGIPAAWRTASHSRDTSAMGCSGSLQGKRKRSNATANGFAGVTGSVWFRQRSWARSRDRRRCPHAPSYSRHLPGPIFRYDRTPSRDHPPSGPGRWHRPPDPLRPLPLRSGHRRHQTPLLRRVLRVQGLP